MNRTINDWNSLPPTFVELIHCHVVDNYLATGFLGLFLYILLHQLDIYRLCLYLCLLISIITHNYELFLIHRPHPLLENVKS